MTMNPLLYAANNYDGALAGTSSNTSTNLQQGAITGLAFPSIKLGIVVGMTNGGYGAGYTNVTLAATGIAAGSATSPVWPTILVTRDIGISWQQVTLAMGTPTGYRFTLAAGAPAYPDTSSLWCASASLCFAAGGYYPNNAAWTAGGFMGSLGPVLQANSLNGVSTNYNTWNVFPATWQCMTMAWSAGNSTPGCGSIANTAGLLPTYGAVLTTTNGGSIWKYLNVGTISGLTAIAGDTRGKNLYAVGVTAGIVSQTSLASLAVPFYAQPPTIIYSPDYGVTWQNQSAPVIPSCYYQLNTVYVLRGTIAYAAGGNPFSQNAIGALSNFSYGTIIATFNGGFTWSQQPIVSYNTSAGGASNTPFSSGASFSGSIPVINSIAFMTPRQGTYVGKYVGWAVGENGLILKTLTGVPIKTQSNAQQFGTQFNPLTYQWSALTPSSAATYPAALLYPAGNAVTSFPVLFSLYQIIWDNNAVGYIYGQGVILSTHNMGATWQPETPPSVTGNSVWVQVATTLPTTF